MTAKDHAQEFIEFHFILCLISENECMLKHDTVMFVNQKFTKFHAAKISCLTVMWISGLEMGRYKTVCHTGIPTGWDRMAIISWLDWNYFHSGTSFFPIRALDVIVNWQQFYSDDMHVSNCFLCLCIPAFLQHTCLSSLISFQLDSIPPILSYYDDAFMLWSLFAQSNYFAQHQWSWFNIILWL